MKKIINKIEKFLAKTPLRKSLLGLGIFLHNKSYHVIMKFLVKPGEMHPKHEIMKYRDFFLDNIKSTDVILDVGCGNGSLAYALSKKAKYVIGIDISKDNIKQAKRTFKGKNLLFIKGNATTFDFRKLEYKPTRIVLSNVLEHIEHRVSFLRELRRISNTILLRVPLVTRDWLSVYKRDNGYNYKLVSSHYTEYTMEELNEECVNGGWILVDEKVNFGEVWGILRIKK